MFNQIAVLDVYLDYFASRAPVSLYLRLSVLLAVRYGPLRVPQLPPDYLPVVSRPQLYPRQPPGPKVRRRPPAIAVRSRLPYLAAHPSPPGPSLRVNYPLN